jgi:large subunit ribosomal protein L10
VYGDVAAVAKALREFSRTNPLLVPTGGVIGNSPIGAADVIAMAELPSREVLLAQIAGAMQAPMVKTAGLLQALPRSMAYGLKALIEQREAA